MVKFLPDSYNIMSETDSSKIIIGIDPGAKYVGLCVRQGEKVLLASTYVRPNDHPPFKWAIDAVKMVRDDISPYTDALIGIEGVEPPQVYYRGVKNMLKPDNLIKLSIVAGAFAQAFPDAVIIRPHNNGSGDLYPAELTGRRPKTLPGSNNGAGTRNHERSAYDVAGYVMQAHKEGRILDTTETIFSF